MPIPDISHLQYLLLTALLDGDVSGRQLRELLGGQGHKKSGPAFYQIMARMEDARLVEGRYVQKLVEGQNVKERWYKITANGKAAAVDVEQFYQALATRRLGFGGA